MTGMKQRAFISIAILLAAAGVKVRANSIDVSTGAATWTVSIPGESVSAVTPFGAGGGDGSVLCLSTTCGAGGTWVTGGGVAGFDGFWTAQLTFAIPAGATGVTLTYPSFTVDDRAVLELNGVTFASGSGMGLGEMELLDGGPNDPYTFLGNTSGSVTSGFNVGGSNTIEVIINNTGNGIHSPTDDVSGQDNTSFSFTGTVSFTQGTSAPEPGTMVMAAAGLILGIAAYRRRHRRTSPGVAILNPWRP